MSLAAFMLIAPFEQRAKWALLLAILRSPISLKEAAARDRRTVSQIRQWLFRESGCTVQRYSYWCAAFDLRPSFDFIENEKPT